MSAAILAALVGCGGAQEDLPAAPPRGAARLVGDPAQAFCAGGPGITLHSAAWDNPATSLTGLYVTVQHAGAIIASGWTPFTVLDLCVGQDYTVTAADYQNNRFARWEDGTPTWFRGVNLQSNALFTAYYQVGGTILPLYAWPTDVDGNLSPAWTAIAGAHQRWPRVAMIPVVNNQNGPGPSPDASWTRGIGALVAAGCKVAGYVYTDYGRRSLAVVQADITDWRAWYPQVSAIFIDQMSNTTGEESYYAALTSHARSHGFDLVIGNPGAPTAASYAGTVDTMVIHESTDVPASFSAWQASYSPNQFATLTYGLAALPETQVTTNKSSVAYQYVTDDGLVNANPWDGVSTYLDRLLALLGG